MQQLQVICSENQLIKTVNMILCESQIFVIEVSFLSAWELQLIFCFVFKATNEQLFGVYIRSQSSVDVLANLVK